jgi:hypothetical protein
MTNHHNTADGLLTIAVAIYAVADSIPDGDGELAQAFYAEADDAFDIATAMGGRL